MIFWYRDNWDPGYGYGLVLLHKYECQPEEAGPMSYDLGVWCIGTSFCLMIKGGELGVMNFV